MWRRFADILRCPICQHELNLISIEEYKVELMPEDYAKGEKIGIDSSQLDVYVDSGILLCDSCKYWFPILYGLPVLLSYETPIFREFVERYGDVISKHAIGFAIPKETPKPGEQFVQQSFSKEWLDYEYDGVLWGWSYKDREKTLVTEIGLTVGESHGRKFLDIGCGLGVTTWIAEKSYYADSVGIDLSLGVLKAAVHYKANPFLHFVQASLFKLPLEENVFDIVYSHGVLHHTYSTKKAMRAIATFCRPGGVLYVWVYGKHGQRNSWDRRLGYFAEKQLRPFLSRAPAWLGTVILLPITLGYIFFNVMFRIKNPELQRYNFRRALHAARDRFTPLFAHRHSYEEVASWFENVGYEKIQALDWRSVPSVVQKLFRGAVAVSGERKRNSRGN